MLIFRDSLLDRQAILRKEDFVHGRCRDLMQRQMSGPGKVLLVTIRKHAPTEESVMQKM